MDGQCHNIETSAGNSANIAKMWVANKLPANGKLALLALKMIEKMVEWIHTVHKHLDLEFTRLSQQHILEEDALILMSEEVIIKYNRIHMVCHQCMEFVANWANKVAYMTHCIWITCQVHWVMQEFTKGGLWNNPAIVGHIERDLAHTLSSGRSHKGYFRVRV